MIWQGESHSRPDGLQTYAAPDYEDWKSLIVELVKIQYSILDLLSRYALLQAALVGHQIQTLSFSQTAVAVKEHPGLPKKLPTRVP